MNPTQYIDRTTVKQMLGIPSEALDYVMAKAFQLYQAGRYGEVVILCRGLVAADHLYWWSYSLLGAALIRLGRLDEALLQVERGLVHEPEQAKLLLMRGEILAALGRNHEARADLLPVTVTGRPHERVAATRALGQAAR